MKNSNSGILITGGAGFIGNNFVPHSFRINGIIYLNYSFIVYQKDFNIWEGVYNSFDEVPPKLFRGFMKRIFYKYYIYNFNMASIYLVLGFPMFLFGFIYGGVSWYESIVTDY